MNKTCLYCSTVASIGADNCSSYEEAIERTEKRPHGCPWFTRADREYWSRKIEPDAWEFVKQLSDALLKVRPLGGSELFVKRNGQYYADPDYCGRVIDEMRDSLNKEIRARIRLEKQLAAVPQLPQEIASE